MSAMGPPTTPNPKPLPLTPTLRVHMKHTVGIDTDVLPGFYIGYAGSAPSAGALNTFASAIASQWVSHLAPLCPIAYTLTEVVVTDISTTTGAGGVAVVSDPGTRAGPELAAASSTNINFAIARRYRGGKPRIYLPYGTTSDMANPQQWATAYTGAVNSGWSAFMTGVLGAPWAGASSLTQVNVPWYEGVWQGVDSKGLTEYRPNYRAPMIANDTIVGSSCSARIGSQRRRNSAGG